MMGLKGTKTLNPITISITYLNLKLMWLSIFILLSIFTAATYSEDNSASSPRNRLYGKHIRIIWPNWEGNPKGLTGPLKAREMLKYLILRFQFTYEFVRVTEDWLEPTNQTRGQFTYLLNDEADFLMAVMQQTSERNKNFDLTVGYAFDAFSILIPVTDENSSNTTAVIKPFQLLVWLLILISVVSVTLTLKFVQYLLLRTVHLSTNSSENIQDTSHYSYVLGVILSQGARLGVSRLPIRLIAGIWCLAAFVFVQAYTSTLITYILAPTNEPLVSSFNQLGERSDVQIILKKFGNVENMLTTSDGASQLLIRMKARENVKSCVLMSDCLSLIKPGQKTVFVDANLFFRAAIGQRFKETGKCDIEIMDHGLVTYVTVFALQKNSPFTSTINKGLTELAENGLMNFWESWFRPIPPQCSANVKGQVEKGAKQPELRRLSLKNLTGAFVVLIVGISFSLVIFIHEQIQFCFTQKRKRRVQMSNSNI